MKKTVSSWSLHHTLGRYFGADPAPRLAGRPAADAAAPRDGVPLLELPALLKERGFDTVQLCHFNLPSRDRIYLEELPQWAGLDIEHQVVSAVFSSAR